MNSEPSHLAVSSQEGWLRDFHDGLPLLIFVSLVLYFVILRLRR